MLVLLEQRGLLEQDTHPTDARARIVALAAAAEGTFRRLWAAGESIRAQMLRAFQADEAALLVRLLSRVAQALNPESVSVGGLPTSHSPEDEV